jgi:hypothetical protein
MSLENNVASIEEKVVTLRIKKNVIELIDKERSEASLYFTKEGEYAILIFV